MRIIIWRGEIKSSIEIRLVIGAVPIEGGDVDTSFDYVISTGQGHHIHEFKATISTMPENLGAAPAEGIEHDNLLNTWSHALREIVFLANTNQEFVEQLRSDYRFVSRVKLVELGSQVHADFRQAEASHPFALVRPVEKVVSRR